MSEALANAGAPPTLEPKLVTIWKNIDSDTSFTKVFKQRLLALAPFAQVILCYGRCTKRDDFKVVCADGSLVDLDDFHEYLLEISKPLFESPADDVEKLTVLIRESNAHIGVEPVYTATTRVLTLKINFKANTSEPAVVAGVSAGPAGFTQESGALPGSKPPKNPAPASKKSAVCSKPPASDMSTQDGSSTRTGESVLLSRHQKKREQQIEDRLYLLEPEHGESEEGAETVAQFITAQGELVRNSYNYVLREVVAGWPVLKNGNPVLMSGASASATLSEMLYQKEDLIARKTICSGAALHHMLTKDRSVDFDALGRFKTGVRNHQGNQRVCDLLEPPAADKGKSLEQERITYERNGKQQSAKVRSKRKVFTFPDTVKEIQANIGMLASRKTANMKRRTSKLKGTDGDGADGEQEDDSGADDEAQAKDYQRLVQVHVKLTAFDTSLTRGKPELNTRGSSGTGRGSSMEAPGPVAAPGPVPAPGLVAALEPVEAPDGSLVEAEKAVAAQPKLEWRDTLGRRIREMIDKKVPTSGGASAIQLKRDLATIADNKSFINKGLSVDLGLVLSLGLQGTVQEAAEFMASCKETISESACAYFNIQAQADVEEATGSRPQVKPKRPLSGADIAKSMSRNEAAAAAPISLKSQYTQSGSRVWSDLIDKSKSKAKKHDDKTGVQGGKSKACTSGEEDEAGEPDEGLSSDVGNSSGSVTETDSDDEDAQELAEMEQEEKSARAGRGKATGPEAGAQAGKGGTSNKMAKRAREYEGDDEAGDGRSNAVGKKASVQVTVKGNATGPSGGGRAGGKGKPAGVTGGKAPAVLLGSARREV